MWNIDKINQYITDGIEENLHLDYKGFRAIAKQSKEKKEISINVSAFANSDGGTLIYGIKEYDERGKSHLPEKIESIDGKEFTKEWLEQIINSTISPRIQGVIITPIQIGNKEDNQVVFVVEIPKSNTAHQAQDKRYYKRYNFESVMMEDYEIKDIINRLSKSQVELRFDTIPPKRILKTPPYPPVFRIEIWAHNSGNKVIKYLDCYMVGNSKTAENIIEPYVDGEFEKQFSNIMEREVTIGDDTFIINSERAVILPKTSRKIGTIKIKKEFLTDDNTLVFHTSTEDNVKTFKYIGKEILE